VSPPRDSPVLRAPLSRLIRRLSTLGAWVAAVSLVVMMFANAADILGTKLFNQPLPGTSEGTETLLVFVVFLALADAHARREHVAVDLLTSRLGAGSRFWLDVFAQSLMVGLFTLLLWQAWRLGLASYAIREAAAGIVTFPLYPSKLALALGATLTALQAATDLLASLFVPHSRQARA
jgi:TRAP-type C4-dicarboxylate transport system permease small subunit